MRTLLAALVLVGGFGLGVADAAPSAEAKSAKGVENREPVDEGTEFAAKDTVWIWSRILDAEGTKITHVWKRDGNEEWSTKPMAIGSKKWTTNSRRVVKAGSYVVEIQAEDGTKLTEVAFTVK
jgi:Protein of unknown function (DUF2914)